MTSGSETEPGTGCDKANPFVAITVLLTCLLTSHRDKPGHPGTTSYRCPYGGAGPTLMTGPSGNREAIPLRTQDGRDRPGHFENNTSMTRTSTGSLDGDHDEDVDAFLAGTSSACGLTDVPAHSILILLSARCQWTRAFQQTYPTPAIHFLLDLWPIEQW